MFNCSEESAYYAATVELALLRHPRERKLCEFGSGNGMAIIGLLQRYKSVCIESYELDIWSSAMAIENSIRCGLNDRYIIHNQDFFVLQEKFDDAFVIANPPYLPSRDHSDFAMKELWGGVDGNSFIKRLLDLNSRICVVMIPSYADPIACLHYAERQGYSLCDWLSYSISVGEYTNCRSVLKRVSELVSEGRAIYFDNYYYLFGCIFVKRSGTLPLGGSCRKSANMVGFIRSLS